MEPQHWDLPLAIIVVMMLVDKGITWSKYLVGRLSKNGNPGNSTRVELAHEMGRLEKRMDVAGEKMSGIASALQALPDKLRIEWREEVVSLRQGQQLLHDRVTEVSERTARLEGRH